MKLNSEALRTPRLDGACKSGGRKHLALGAILAAVLFLTPAPVGAADGVISIRASNATPPSHQSEPTSAPLDDTTALRVNGIELDRASYDEGLESYLREHDLPATDSAAQQTYEDRLVDRLLVEAYAREAGLDYDAEFRRRLDALRRQLLFDFVIQREVIDNLAITTDSVIRYYQAHQADFTEPEKVQVRHILTDTREKAEQARARLLAGEEFTSVAAELSIHPSRRQGGLLPSFSRGTYQPAFERVAFSLEVGELSPVVETELGFHVIEKTAEVPARLKPLEEVATQIRSLIYEAQRKKKTAEFLEGLRRRARIERPEEREGS